MKTLLWINLIVEGLAGLLFLFFPGLPEMIPGLNGLAGSGLTMLMKMYGVAALTLAIFSGLLLFRLKYYEAVLTDGLALFTLFHLGIATTQFLYNTDVRPGMVHALLGLAFLWYWIKRR